MQEEVTLMPSGWEAVSSEGTTIIIETDLTGHTGNLLMHTIQLRLDNLSFCTSLPGSDSSEGFFLSNVLSSTKHNFF